VFDIVHRESGCCVVLLLLLLLLLSLMLLCCRGRGGSVLGRRGGGWMRETLLIRRIHVPYLRRSRDGAVSRTTAPTSAGSRRGRRIRVRRPVVRVRHSVVSGSGDVIVSRRRCRPRVRRRRLRLTVRGSAHGSVPSIVSGSRCCRAGVPSWIDRGL